MYRGTTPTLTFNLPFEVAQINVLYITFAQENRVVFEKTKDDCELNESKVVCKLNQEETLWLYGSEMVEIQLRVKTLDGTVLASEVFERDVRRILKDGEI